MEWWSGSYPEESRIITPVPGCGVEHIRSQNAVDDAHNVAVVKSG